MRKMALFEGYERRINQVNSVLNKYNIGSIEDAKKICDDKGIDVYNLEAYSAGTENYSEVKPLAVQVMEEAGVDMSGHHPKLLSDIPAEVDILITMGCNVECPYVPCKFLF
jgi:protein-tyrosine-phosphatase